MLYKTKQKLNTYIHSHHVCTYVHNENSESDTHINVHIYICMYIRTYAELEIAAGHLPFSEQNMNMADQD